MKLANLKNLLRATPNSNKVRIRPSEEEIKEKLQREKMSNFHTKKPEALEALRSFRKYKQNYDSEDNATQFKLPIMM